MRHASDPFLVSLSEFGRGFVAEGVEDAEEQVGGEMSVVLRLRMAVMRVREVWDRRAT
jgi:hypothetical protein